MPRKIAIIGAGPIGLHAGLAARQRGFETALFERGAIADSVKRWGHVLMFSPFAMNASLAGLEALRRRGAALPAEDVYLTGAEYAAAYLEPLAQELEVSVYTSVKAVARDTSGKRDKIGEPDRAGTRFRLLVVDNGGGERHEYADIVLDCSGTFSQPNPLGDAGIPALGESAARGLISYGLAETANLQDFAGRSVLVVGGGHSAANLIAALAELQKEAPQIRIHWVTRRHGAAPCAIVTDDPLQERQRICAAANAAVAEARAEWHAGATVLALAQNDGALEVTLRKSGAEQILTVDRAIAATGFRPDWSFVRELHLQTCWATEGTYPLAASLLGEIGGDCLAVAAFGVDSLAHPEPNFFPLGMKSYGRTPDFLIATGLQQIEAVMERLVINC